MPYLPPRLWNQKLADGKGENKIFKAQQAESFGGATDFGDMNAQFANEFRDMMGERFGRQGQTFDIMNNALSGVFGAGPGSYDLPPRGTFMPDGSVSPGGRVSGPNGAGGNVGRAGSAGGGGAGGTAMNPLGDVPINSGFLESDYGLLDRAKGYGRMERAMVSDAAERNALSYQGSMDAVRAKMLQSGASIVPGSGQEQEMIAKAAYAQSGANAADARNIAIEMMQRRADDARQAQQVAAQLGMAKGSARQQTSQWTTAQQQKVAMAAAAARQQAAARAQSARNAAAQAGAMRQAAKMQGQQFTEAQRLASAQLQSDNFFRGMGVLTGAMNAQNPLGYGELGLGGLQQGGNIYGNLYGQGSQGMVQTRGGGWSGILGNLAGAALGGLTGGISTGLSGAIGGMMGGGGGQSGGNLGAYQWGSPNRNVWGG